MSRRWEIERIGNFCKVMYGYTGKASIEQNGPKYLRITDIQNNSVNWGLVPRCEPLNENFEKYQLRYGDIVFSRTGGTTGKSYLIEEDTNAIFASYLIRVQADQEKVLPKFFYYFFQSPRYWNIINQGILGSTHGGFNAKKLKQIETPIPPLQEQKQIVSLLDQAFQAIDQAKANVDQNIENAEELFQSKLNDVFFNKGQGFSFRQLGEVCHILDRFRRPVKKRNRISGNIPYYGATGALDYINDYIFDERLVLLGEDGAKWGCFEKSAFIISGKAWVNNHAHVIRTQKDLLDESWLVYYFIYKDLLPWVSGMTVPKLNQANLRRIPIPIIPIQEQREFIEELDNLSMNQRALVELYQCKISKLNELKSSILQKAFEGELTQKAAKATADAYE